MKYIIVILFILMSIPYSLNSQASTQDAYVQGVLCQTGDCTVSLIQSVGAVNYIIGSSDENHWRLEINCMGAGGIIENSISTGTGLYSGIICNGIDPF